MRIPIVNATIYQGEDFTLPVQLLGSDGAGDPLADYTDWKLILGTVPGGAFIGAGVVTVDDAAEGEISLRIPSEVTALLTTTVAAYDVWVTSPLGDEIPVLRGPACPVVLRVPES